METRSSAMRPRQLRAMRETGNNEGIQGASLEEATPVLPRPKRSVIQQGRFLSVCLGSLRNSRADSLRLPCSRPVPGVLWPFTPGYKSVRSRTIPSPQTRPSDTDLSSGLLITTGDKRTDRNRPVRSSPTPNAGVAPGNVVSPDCWLYTKLQ